jgi:hypothetical protein
MAVILLEKDPFVESMQDSLVASDTNVNIRRPLSGTSLKTERHAYISVYSTFSTTGGGDMALIDSSAPGGQGAYNHNFLLQSVEFTKSEKSQVLQTFGQEYAFFFGAKPTVVSVSGMLINTRDFNWKNEWVRNYDRYLGGTKCAENKARVYLGYDDVLMEGYITATAVIQSMDSPYVCPFQFQLLLTTYYDLSEENPEYVLAGDQARTASIGRTTSGLYVEYIGDVKEATQIYEVTADGKWEKVNLTSKTMVTPDALNSSAGWAGTQSVVKPERDPGVALASIDRDSAAQQSGKDPLTLNLEQKNGGASNFGMSSRSSSTGDLTNALSSGVAGAAAVVDEYSG